MNTIESAEFIYFFCDGHNKPKIALNNLIFRPSSCFYGLHQVFLDFGVNCIPTLLGNHPQRFELFGSGIPLLRFFQYSDSLLPAA